MRQYGIFGVLSNIIQTKEMLNYLAQMHADNNLRFTCQYHPTRYFAVMWDCELNKWRKIGELYAVDGTFRDGNAYYLISKADIEQKSKELKACNNNLIGFQR